MSLIKAFVVVKNLLLPVVAETVIVAVMVGADILIVVSSRLSKNRVSSVSCRIGIGSFEGEPLITSELSISHSASLELNRC